MTIEYDFALDSTADFWAKKKSPVMQLEFDAVMGKKEAEPFFSSPRYYR